MLGEACVCKGDAPTCPNSPLPIRRDDSSHVLIGAVGMWRSDWRRRNVGSLNGQSACRVLAIDSTRAGAIGNLKSATTKLMWV